MNESNRVEPPAEEPPPEEERLDEDKLALSYWPLWVLPFAGVGLAFLFIGFFPDFVTNFYLDTVLPFGATFWLGTFFSYGWDLQRLWIQELPRKWAPWIVGAGLMLVLVIIGGPAAIIDDPWLVGMVIFPGVRMWMGYQKRRPARQT